MYIELAAAAYLIGSYVYHRLTDEPPPKQTGELQIPTTEEGVPRAKIFGRDRIRRPVLEWLMDPEWEERVANAVYDLRSNQFLTLGSGFWHGNGTTTPVATNRLHAIYVGDQKLIGTFDTMTGNGAFESAATSLVKDDYSIVGNVEFLNGGPAQQLVNGGAATYAGTAMIDVGVSEDHISGYRQRLGVTLFQFPLGFNHGRKNGLPSYQFEASSYHNHSQLGTYARVGSDSNPVNVIYEVLTAPDMLNLPESVIDMPNFKSVQYTLHTETHGYSRVWDERTEANEIIYDVLRQIDGFLYEDMDTGKLKLRLARNDYDPGSLFVIKRSNCRKITNFAMSSRVNVINKVTVVFENREKNYDDDSASAQNMANAAGMDGQVVEEVIEYRGCKRANLAAYLAGRELGVRSRPNVKMTAHVGRVFLPITIGDVVKVEWNAPDINAVFRVVGVDRGEPGDEIIKLDLILDHNYVWRNDPPTSLDLAGEIDDEPVFSGGLT